MFRSLLFVRRFPVPSVLKTATLRAFGTKIGRGVVVRGLTTLRYVYPLRVLWSVVKSRSRSEVA
jgi:hypothetical protein